MTGDRWLIAGLGNPGPGYAGNRHNAGFLTADVLAARAGARFKAGKFRALAAEGRLAGRGVTIIKPVTFMNSSGGPVAGISGYYRLTAVRLKLGGGDNGHNGLRSVTARMGTREYYRARVGIGRPPGRMDAAAYVLRDFSAAERKELPLVLERAADAVEMLLADGLAAAQNAFHAGAAPGGPSP
jgi:PTH1 family peptidyl-tRNA hydrolase